MATRFAAAILTAALTACVGPVQSGSPPLVEGCRADADCPTDYFCQAGACEQRGCQSACDCPAPFGCAQGRCLSESPRYVPDGGCPDAG